MVEDREVKSTAESFRDLHQAWISLWVTVLSELNRIFMSKKESNPTPPPIQYKPPAPPRPPTAPRVDKHP